MQEKRIVAEQEPVMDIEGFDALVRDHTQGMLRFTINRVKDAQVAEDLVQTAFIAAWEGRHRFIGQSSKRTWLYSILKNKLADHYRKHYRDPVIHDPGSVDHDRFDANGRWRPEDRPTPWPEEEGENKEALQRYLAKCLKELPESWRAAIEMKFLRGDDASAICQELGITATNYWQQIHRAKLKLRDCISKQIASNR